MSVVLALRLILNNFDEYPSQYLAIGQISKIVITHCVFNALHGQRN